MVDSRKFNVGDIIVPKDGKYPGDAMEVVDFGTGTLQASPIGGGFGVVLTDASMAHYQFRVVPEAERSVPWQNGWFHLEESPYWPGFTKGYKWNGWATPMFEKAEGLKIMEYLKGHSNDVAEYREATDSFFIKFRGNDDDDPGCEAKGQDITLHDGRTVHVYPIGDGFTWMERKAEECEHCGVALTKDLQCPECGVSHSGEPCRTCGHFGLHKDDCTEPPGMHTEGGPAHVEVESELSKLVEVFKRAYQYYRGWGFSFEHPGIFTYYQLGGDLTVCFTPDWNDEGLVDVQVQTSEGDCLDNQGGEHTFTTNRTAPALFKIVKPYLDRLDMKSAADLRRKS